MSIRCVRTSLISIFPYIFAAVCVDVMSIECVYILNFIIPYILQQSYWLIWALCVCVCVCTFLLLYSHIFLRQSLLLIWALSVCIHSYLYISVYLCSSLCRWYEHWVCVYILTFIFPCIFAAAFAVDMSIECAMMILAPEWLNCLASSSEEKKIIKYIFTLKNPSHGLMILFFYFSEYSYHSVITKRTRYMHFGKAKGSQCVLYMQFIINCFCYDSYSLDYLTQH